MTASFARPTRCMRQANSENLDGRGGGRGGGVKNVVSGCGVECVVRWLCFGIVVNVVKLRGKPGHCVRFCATFSKA